MVKSNFIEVVDKYLEGIIGSIVEKYNDKYQEETLLYRQYLNEEYSADLTWSSADFANNIVAADVVSMDSSLPLKKRDSFGTAVGQIPKIGISFTRSEKFLTDVRIMMARGAKEAEIATKILQDVARVINGIEVRTEILFEQALSSGMVLVEDADDPSVGIRALFGYKAENMFKAINAAWGADEATPIDDIEQMFAKANADGNSIAKVFLSKKYFDYIRASKQGKNLVATYNNAVVTSLDNLMKPSRQAMLDALVDNFGAQFVIVDSSFRIQCKDGSIKTVKPWEEANIVGVPDTNTVGRLVYGTLAEETSPVADVTYAKAGTSILVAEFGETNPLREFTTGQSLRMPVIDNAHSIYMLTANAVAEPSLLPDEAAEGLVPDEAAEGLV